MRTKTFFKILSVFVATSLAGCDVKDPIYDTPHPNHGTVTLTTHWSGIGEGLTAPASYTVAVTPVAGGATGSYTATVNGTTATLDQLSKYFTICGMPIAPSQYWPMVHGSTPEDVRQDEEGMQIMRMLGRNMAYMIRAFALARENGLLPPDMEKPKMRTNFIR